MGLFSRKLRKDLDSSRTIDAESKNLWDAFRHSEELICCKAARQMINRGLVTMTYLYTKQKDIVERIDVKIQYCSGCGRKLV